MVVLQFNIRRDNRGVGDHGDILYSLGTMGTPIKLLLSSKMFKIRSLGAKETRVTRVLLLISTFRDESPFYGFLLLGRE